MTEDAPAALSSMAGVSVLGSFVEASWGLAVTGSVVMGAAGVSVMAAVREMDRLASSRSG